MPNRKHELNAENQLHPSPGDGAHQAQAPRVQDSFLLPPGLLASAARAATPKAGEETRAARLNRAATRLLLLQMQRWAGNRHVQRLLDQAASPVESSVRHARGQGKVLDDGVRDRMETAFGVDFSGVRLHTDARAHELNQALNARAFTTGQGIFFRQGTYNPESPDGQELLAHELTHVVQQTGELQAKLAVGAPGDQFEQEADRVARSVMRSAPVAPRLQTPESSGRIQRNGETTREAIPSGGSSVNKVGIIYKEDGANVRDKPDSHKKPIGLFPFNTTVAVIKSFSGDRYFVSRLDTGEMGYVAANRIWTHLPEPNAKLHKIKAGEGAQAIARKYYGEAAKPGRDERYYVNVLVHVNKGEGDPSRGIYKENKNDSWDETKTRANYLIWIPSTPFANSLVGAVKSGSITGGLFAAIKSFAQGVDDILEAIGLSLSYIPEAIARQVEETLKKVLVSLAIFLVGAVGILAVSTAIGAAVGALAGGVGAGPGAAIGFKIGLIIIKYLGLAMLVTWLATSLYEIGGAFWAFLKTAWGAKGNVKTLDRAAREFAEAIGLLVGFLLEALIFYAIKAGMPRALGTLGKTRFGRWIGQTRLAKWIEARLAAKPKGATEAETKTVPESVKGLEFGGTKDGYVPGRLLGTIFNQWTQGGKIAPEGWKIHVSSTPASSPRVAEIVLPKLRAMKVNHKVVNSPEQLANMSGTQAGKFITIYPRDAAHAKSIASALDGALAGKGQKGPVIIGEKPIGKSGLIYTRYGGFTKSTVTDPSGREVPDVRGKIKPDWIPDPWGTAAGSVPKPVPVPLPGKKKEDLVVE